MHLCCHRLLTYRLVYEALPPWVLGKDSQPAWPSLQDLVQSALTAWLQLRWETSPAPAHAKSGSADAGRLLPAHCTLVALYQPQSAPDITQAGLVRSLSYPAGLLEEVRLSAPVDQAERSCWEKEGPPSCVPEPADELRCCCQMTRPPKSSTCYWEQACFFLDFSAARVLLLCVSFCSDAAAALLLWLAQADR